MSTTYPPEHLSNGYSPNHHAYTNGHGHNHQSMDGRQGDYPQSGLNSPYNQSFAENHSEGSTLDQASAAQYPQGQDVKYNPSATPTSDYGLNPAASRSGQFPDYIQRATYPDGSQRYGTTGVQSSTPGNMAQSSSPSTPLNNGHSLNHHGANNVDSDNEIPVDPSIATSNSAYSQHHYAYPPQHEASHYQPSPGMYPPHQYGTPYGGGHPVPYGHIPPHMSTPPQMVSAGARPPGGGHPLSTVYSFVPIPGTHQQKRPRRRYEEIERMYKCGYNGCEKAYGTLNHLNAHVTMQSHGTKRTPEEFKEIRKEWKQRKKEEDAARKADDDRARSVHHQSGPPGDAHNIVEGAQTQGVRQLPQLPPLGYQPASGQIPAQYAQSGANMDGLPQYSSGQMGNYYPQSPYGPSGQMYQQNENGSSGSGHSPA